MPCSRENPARRPHMWLLLFEVGLLEISDPVFVWLLWMRNRNLLRFTWLPVWQGAQLCLRQEATDCRVKHQCHRPKWPLPAGMQIYDFSVVISPLDTSGCNFLRLWLGWLKGSPPPALQAAAAKPASPPAMAVQVLVRLRCELNC